MLEKLGEEQGTRPSWTSLHDTTRVALDTCWLVIECKVPIRSGTASGRDHETRIPAFFACRLRVRVVGVLLNSWLIPIVSSGTTSAR